MENINNHNSIRAHDLNAYLLSRGISSIQTKEIAQLLSIPENQVRQRMALLRRRGEFVSPARGFWVPVPPDKRNWGAPEPWAYFEDMMAHLDSGYCVGWLTAAAVHGASHQAAQVFQVAVSKHMNDRIVGRSQLQFRTRIAVNDFPAQVVTRPEGRLKVATPETTALMLAADLDMASGIDNLATIILELAESGSLQPDLLMEAAPLFPMAAVRRLGWVLDEFSSGIDTDELADWSSKSEVSASHLTANAESEAEYNKRWSIVINRKVEPDI